MSLDDERNGGPFGGTGETRTRLPEGEGDTRRSSRSGRTSSRSLVTVVGVVVLLIAAIAFANRGDGGSAGSTGDEKKPDAAATAPTGEKPVTGKTGTIPSGFAHDEQGAQSAASNYAVSLVSADILKPARRTEIVKQLFVADKVTELEGEFDRTYSKEFLSKVGLDENGNAAPGQTYVSRTVPVGTKVTEYADSGATVEVWCTGAFGTAGEKTTNPVSNDWFTLTLKLRWADSDWKVESFRSKDGPAPVNGDNKISTADEIAKAVEEYGGFTYAR
ncbi:Integral membrane protein OS=Streptomyces alboniger OX=132473 GN=CP975_16595 PE=4 SV=1 [Streptomyces alboniger]